MADQLVIRGAREHNLKNISLDLPRDRLIVFTGLSGSGKSSLAFDTIYAEGQRRYVESLSAYARQFLGQMDKPDVDFIEGLSPAISIDQKSASRNPRSTVGTITEVYDYLRLLYARIGVPHCPKDGTVVTRQTPQQIVDRILELPEGTRFQVLAPVVRGRKGTYDTLLADLATQGFARVRVDGEIHELTELASQGAELARYEHAHHRGRRRPPGPARRHRAPPHRLARDRPAAGRGRGRDRARAPRRRGPERRGARGADLQPAPGLPHLRHAPSRSWPPATSRSTRPTAPATTCDGLGTRSRSTPSWSCPTPTSPSSEGAIAPWASGHSQYFKRLLEAVAEDNDIPVDVAVARAAREGQQAAALRRRGQAGPGQVQEPLRPHPQLPRQVRGGLPYLQRRHAEAESDSAREQIEGYMREVPCPECDGARLKPLSLAVTVDGRNIHELCSLSIGEAAELLARPRALRARPA